MSNTRTQVALRYNSIIIPRPSLFEKIINVKYINFNELKRFLTEYVDFLLLTESGIFFNVN